MLRKRFQLGENEAKQKEVFSLEEKMGSKSGRLPKKQERKLAQSLKGHRQPGSGCLPQAKGDVVTDLGLDLMIECKETEDNSIRLQGVWLEKISREATAQNRWPALQLTIHGLKDRTANEWMAVPMPLFQLMLKQLQSKKEP